MLISLLQNWFFVYALFLVHVRLWYFKGNFYVQYWYPTNITSQCYVHNFQAVSECSIMDELLLSWYIKSYVRQWISLIYYEGCLLWSTSRHSWEGESYCFIFLRMKLASHGTTLLHIWHWKNNRSLKPVLTSWLCFTWNPFSSVT
jgi:hypothetical protein